MFDIISRFAMSSPTQNTGFIIGSSVIVTLAAIALGRLAFRADTPKRILSPRATQLPSLSEAEKEKLPFPPDLFPGGREVDSPVSHMSCKERPRANLVSQYGTIRVYEWGPETGRKVLLVHGISTPCLSLGGVANALVEKGCRVMLFDLWGRGYSDDSRLYTTEILLAITSSPLAWTPEGFSMIGYSLGGGICADFASYFPKLVNALVLLAPAGLMRPSHISWQSRLMYTGLLPGALQRWVVRRRLIQGLEHPNTVKAEEPEIAVAEEVSEATGPVSGSSPLSRTRPDITVASAVRWQLDNHAGFVNSFVSSIRYSSTVATQETWEAWRRLGLRKDKVMIFAGTTDPIMYAANFAFLSDSVFIHSIHS
jgi:pimeloyl-ACP methyl ester carboxylesterase